MSADKTSVIGISLIAHKHIEQSENAKVLIGDQELTVPMQFFGGDLNLVQTELHKMVDVFFETLITGHNNA